MDIQITLTYKGGRKHLMRVYRADEWGMRRACRWLVCMFRKVQAQEVVDAAEKIKDGEE